MISQSSLDEAIALLKLMRQQQREKLERTGMFQIGRRFEIQSTIRKLDYLVAKMKNLDNP